MLTNTKFWSFKKSLKLKSDAWASVLKLRIKYVLYLYYLPFLVDYNDPTCFQKIPHQFWERTEDWGLIQYGFFQSLNKMVNQFEGVENIYLLSLPQFRIVSLQQNILDNILLGKQPIFFIDFFFRETFVVNLFRIWTAISQGHPNRSW